MPGRDRPAFAVRRGGADRNPTGGSPARLFSGRTADAQGGRRPGLQSAGRDRPAAREAHAITPGFCIGQSCVYVGNSSLRRPPQPVQAGPLPRQRQALRIVLVVVEPGGALMPEVVQCQLSRFQFRGQFAPEGDKQLFGHRQAGTRRRFVRIHQQSSARHPVSPCCRAFTQPGDADALDEGTHSHPTFAAECFALRGNYGGPFALPRCVVGTARAMSWVRRCASWPESMTSWPRSRCGAEWIHNMAMYSIAAGSLQSRLTEQWIPNLETRYR